MTTLKNTILWVPLFLSVTLSYAQLSTPISLPCEELPFDSFPPNQLLRSENSEGSAIRVLSSGKIGTWGEFFIEVNQVGTLQGTNRYSIFEVTPKEYQVPGWLERTQGESTIWEIAAMKIQLHSGVPSQLKLSYSRRSGCVMASLFPSDGSSPVTLRDLTDLRTPDHPLLLELAGAATFSEVSLRLLNQLVYKWDPDTTRIVLRPGKPGSWDEKGAFNPAVVVRNGLWYLVYRGNAKPAPPNGPISSDLGLAMVTSWWATDFAPSERGC